MTRLMSSQCEAAQKYLLQKQYENPDWFKLQVPYITRLR